MKSAISKRLSREIRGRRRAKISAGHGVGVVAETKNGLFAVHAEDFNVSRILLRAGEYHWLEISLLESLLSENSRRIFIAGRQSENRPVLFRSGGKAFSMDAQ